MPDTVLVIEDDATLVPFLVEELSGDGITPVFATAGGALLEIRRGLRPDVIVVDLDARDGVAVLGQLELEVEIVPLVALSSHPRRLLAAGAADAVVMKPCRLGQLRRCVHRACEQPRGAV